MKFFCLFLFSLGVNLASAQVFIEYAPVGAAAVGEYNFYGTNTLPKGIPYTRIRGSAFHRDDWQLASFYAGRKRFCVLPARMNLATQEIHYLIDGKEMVAHADNGITALIFHRDNDTTKLLTAFVKAVPGAFLKDEPLTGFLQVLNSGPYKLLKFISRQVHAADSLFGTQKRYFFKDNTYYYVQSGDKMEPVNKLTDENFLSLLPQSSLFRNWIREQKLNFKKEEDLLAFLAHYNANRPIAPK